MKLAQCGPSATQIQGVGGGGGQKNANSNSLQLTQEKKKVESALKKQQEETNACTKKRDQLEGELELDSSGAPRRPRREALREQSEEAERGGSSYER